MHAPPVYEPYTFTHFAGSMRGPGYSDGTRSAARFASPEGVATDAAGSVYVGDTLNHGIRKGFPAPRFAAFHITANGGFAIRIAGPADRTCQIDSSTNFNSSVNWLPIDTNTAPFW